MKNHNYKKVEVTCPICQIVKSINVPDVIFSQKKFGTIKIQVPTGAVCPDHQFIVFVDSNCIVRGYEKIDIQMKNSREDTVRETTGLLTLEKLIMVFGTYGILSLMHAKIFNYPIKIIVGENFKIKLEILNLIGDRILPKKYRTSNSMSFIEEKDYSKIKIKEKNALWMDSNQNILNTPWQEKLKFEELILKNALEIIEVEEQLIIIQQMIAKFIREAEYFKEILESVSEIYEDELIEKVSKDLMAPKVNTYRLSLIKQFIIQRYSPKLLSKIKNKVEEFLDLL